MEKILIASSFLVGFAVSACVADATATTTNSNSTTWSVSEHRFGAGIILGEPTGVSLKYWLNDTMAIDGAIGASFNAAR